MTDLRTDLDRRITAARRTVEQQRAEVRVLAVEGRTIVEQLAEQTSLADLHEKAAHVLTSIGEQRQDAAQRAMETLVSQGLQTIFGDDLTFHLVPGVRARSPVVDFVVRSRLADGTAVDTDVLSARGGGLAAVVGFLLRLVRLLLSRQRQDSVLFLDETFAHVSADYLPRLIEFLKDLVARTGVQIIMVTHDESFQDAADTVYKLTLVDGVTRVKRL